MVYITGDLHGDKARLKTPAMRRLKKGDTLIVCGDFGFVWNGGRKEKRLLAKLGAQRYQVVFVDGCHENFEQLAQYPEGSWNGGRARRIVGKLLWLQRGEYYTIDGHTYFVCGGGLDPERADSDEAPSMPTEQELLHGLETLRQHDNTVEYIITHEPSGKASGYFTGYASESGLGIYFNRLEETVAYQRWYCGSLHINKPLSRKHMAVFTDVVEVVSGLPIGHKPIHQKKK